MFFSEVVIDVILFTVNHDRHFPQTLMTPPFATQTSHLFQDKSKKAIPHIHIFKSVHENSVLPAEHNYNQHNFTDLLISANKRQQPIK
jgi:hypothetical protein